MPTTLDTTPAWSYLDQLSPFRIPSDLTEIDVHWVWCQLCDADDPQVVALADEIPWETLKGFAEDLRDIWGDAQREQAYWDRHERFDYE